MARRRRVRPGRQFTDTGSLSASRSGVLDPIAVGVEQARDEVDRPHDRRRAQRLEAERPEVRVETGRELADLASQLVTYPQVLVNVRVREKQALASVPSIAAAMERTQFSRARLT